MIAAQAGNLVREASQSQAGRQSDKERMAMTALVLRRKSRQRVAMPASRTLSRGKQNFQESVDPEREIVDNQLYRETTRA